MLRRTASGRLEVDRRKARVGAGVDGGIICLRGRGDERGRGTRGEVGGAGGECGGGELGEAVSLKFPGRGNVQPFNEANTFLFSSFCLSP